MKVVPTMRKRSPVRTEAPDVERETTGKTAASKHSSDRLQSKELGGVF